MIFDIREEVQAALQGNGNYRGFRGNVSMVGIYTGTNVWKTCWGIKLQCDSNFGQLRPMKKEDARINFLKKDPHGSKILRHQSLVCLVSGQDIISFGMVDRMEELLVCNLPVIVLQLDSNVNIKKTLFSLKRGRTVQLIQIQTAVLAFVPVLAALKECRVLLYREIVLWSPGSPVALLQNGIALLHIVDAITSDPSVDIGKRLSLIQGPPETGKPFLGAILAKTIHDEKTIETILVICYTNHALDQFLRDLLKHDVPAKSIIRPGGRSNQALDHLSLSIDNHASEERRKDEEVRKRQEDKEEEQRRQERKINSVAGGNVSTRKSIVIP